MKHTKSRPACNSSMAYTVAIRAGSKRDACYFGSRLKSQNLSHIGEIVWHDDTTKVIGNAKVTGQAWVTNVIFEGDVRYHSTTYVKVQHLHWWKNIP